MSEERDSLELQLSQAAEKSSLWRQLIDHPGWKLLIEELTLDAHIRKEVVCSTPLGGESNVYAQEFIKGEFSGITRVLKHPETRLEEAKREVVLLNAHLENEDAAEAAAKPAKSRVDTDEHFGE